MRETFGDGGGARERVSGNMESGAAATIFLAGDRRNSGGRR
jgi:hypothetical protein